MVKKRRYCARREYFGFTVYDKLTGELFLLPGDLFPSTVQLRSGPLQETITRDDVEILDTQVVRNDSLVGPVYAEVYVTRFCNERCTFCYVGHLLSTKRVEMSEQLLGVVARELRTVGVFDVAILGGEPFLYTHLTNAIESLVGLGFRVAVSTNGSVLNEKAINLLVETDSTLNVSFHSHIPELHSAIVGGTVPHSKVVEFIRYLTDRDYAPVISLVLNQLNLETAVATAHFLFKSGVKSISLYHLVREGFTVSNRIGVRFSEYRRVFCEMHELASSFGAQVKPMTNYPFLLGADYSFEPPDGPSSHFYGTIDGRRAIYVDYDGQVYASPYGFGQASNALGNLATDDAQHLWNFSKQMNHLRTAKLPNYCYSCTHVSYCRGGSVSNYLASPDPAKLPDCPLYSEALSE